MAKETAITQFIGVDHVYEFPILNEAETAAVDVSGWALSWMVKKSKSHADADASITAKTVANGKIAVAGIYDSDPDASTQVVRLTVVDTDTDALSSGTYYHELKRTGDGVETILSYGTFTLEKAVHKT